MPLEDLQARLRRLQAKARRDMIINSAIGLVMFVIFVRIFANAQRPTDRIGWGLALAGVALLVVPLLRETVKILRGERLPSGAGMTTSLRFYRNMLENRRLMSLGSRSRINAAGVIALFSGMVVLLIPPIQVFYSRLQEPGAPDLTPWIPFLAILVLWGILFIVFRRRGRRWLRREFEMLESLEKEI